MVLGPDRNFGQMSAGRIRKWVFLRLSIVEAGDREVWKQQEDDFAYKSSPGAY